MIFDRNGRQIEFSLDREIIFLDDVFTMLRRCKRRCRRITTIMFVGNLV